MAPDAKAGVGGPVAAVGAPKHSAALGASKEVGASLLEKPNEWIRMLGATRYEYTFIVWEDLHTRFPTEVCIFQLRNYGITTIRSEHSLTVAQSVARCEIGLLTRYWVVPVCRGIHI